MRPRRQWMVRVPRSRRVHLSKFCGAKNSLNIGSSTTELELYSDVIKANADAGFGSVEACYDPESLLEFFGLATNASCSSTHPLHAVSRAVKA